MTSIKFRRGDRVRAVGKGPYEGRLGTITNPKLTYGLIRVRLDLQGPWEKGMLWRPEGLVHDTTGETQYDQRCYDLRFSHDEIMALRTALENVNVRNNGLTDTMVKRLLQQLPELP